MKVQIEESESKKSLKMCELKNGKFYRTKGSDDIFCVDRSSAKDIVRFYDNGFVVIDKAEYGWELVAFEEVVGIKIVISD